MGELTKVDSNESSTPDCEADQTMKTNNKVQQKSQPGTNFRNNIIEASNEAKLNSFALDFSARREPATVDDLQSDIDDGNESCQDDSDIKISTSNDWSKRTSIESEPIPKMNINMFIQKDSKQTVRNWPKVETHAGPKKSKDISPTKQLIGKFNQGLNQPADTRPPPNKLKSPTKLLINKFNNPSDMNKIPAPGGFQGINPMTSNNKKGSAFQHKHFNSPSTFCNKLPTPSKSPVPLPRFQNTDKPSQVAKLVSALNTSGSLQDEEDEANRVSILKRNCGLHGWQAADI